MYDIIEYKDIKNVLSPSEVSPENIYMYIYKLKTDVVYIVENDCLLGVISVGDLLRYYDKNIPLEINRNFRFSESFNSVDIDEILKEIPSIHELPVIDKNRRFLGIIKAGQKAQKEWDWLESYIDDKRFGNEEEYLYQEFKDWLLKQRAKVIIYDELSWDAWEKMIPGSKKVFEKRTENASKEDILPLYVIKNMPDIDQKIFFGDNYSKNCIQEFMENYEKIELVSENGIYFIKDLTSKYFTFKNGYRVTPNNTGEMRKVYIYGACHILGTYVPDNGTIEYFLKQELKNGRYPYDVINGGLWKGGESNLWINKMLRTNFKEGDIVIIAQTLDVLKLLKEDQEMNNKYFLFEHFGNTYREIENNNIFSHFLDHPYHHDSFFNKLAAKNILKDITPFLQKRSDDYFIPWSAIRYYKKFFAVQGIKPLNKKTGAIIMTCNPFTKGHRYLIEKASEKVEFLYVFVVEQEVLGFSFEDRFKMICSGTCDIQNVKVLPLGKYIVAKETFPQYFDRDNVTEIQEPDYDSYVFADTIAKELGITYRFVGEEPLDKVTMAYNESLKRILPKSGIKVEEIPRKRNEHGDIISASTVRQLIKDKNIEELYSFLPNTTISYLKGKGIIPERNK